MKASKRIAVCGMTAALSVVVMIIGGVLGLGMYASPMIAGICLTPIGRKYGARYQWTLWAAVSLLQGEQLRAIGLLAIFGCATLARSTLEPRLVGRQLGLDPLLTLAALYTGFRLWGFFGLLAAPILTAAVKSVLDARSMEN